MRRLRSPAVVALLVATACATGSGVSASRETEGSPENDPRGIYDVTLASQGMVSEGTMTLRGIPGEYRGTLSMGGFSAEIGEVEVGPEDMHLRARTDRGTLILRLLRDGDLLSGNWILGEQRGTVAAQKRRDSGQSAPAAPVSTGSSSVAPHSDHEPS